MTIMATHFAVVLGAWRLRVRIDIDEPRDDHERAAAAPVAAAVAPREAVSQVTVRGRG
jgi:hypothetical protein